MRCMPCRSEKKVLNEINHSKEPEQLRYHVMADNDASKVKQRLGTAAEKLFVLVRLAGWHQGWGASAGACRSRLRPP
jgi:hypothetical protein